jgi:hypothetical protein
MDMGGIMTVRIAWMLLVTLLLGACTTKFKEPADSDAEGDALPEGGDGDIAGDEAGDPDAEDTVPDVECATAADCTTLGEQFICCNRVCVDGSLDPMNCGGCGTRCGDSEACCGGTCTNTGNDENHCGVCGNACDPNDQCCQGFCRNVGNDPDHCGNCDTSCDIGSACDEASCISCASATIGWPGGEQCYLTTGLGRYSHLSVLTPIFDGRLNRVPEAISPLYNPPLFGVLTVDNVPVDDPATMREYVVQVRRWGPDGAVDAEFLKEYTGDGTGILALDAVHLPRPDMPGRLLVTLGGARTTNDGATRDDLFIDTVDIAPGSMYVEPFFYDVGAHDIEMPAVYWQLPVPYEAVLSLAGIEGGAVIGVGSAGNASNLPAAAVKRAPTASDEMLDWPARDEECAYASHMATSSTGRIFVLVTEDRTGCTRPDSPDYNVRLYCFNSSVIDLIGPSPAMQQPCWGEEIPYAAIANSSEFNEVGLALAVGPGDTSYVVYEQVGQSYQIVHVDEEGLAGPPTEILVGPSRQMAVSALLVDVSRDAVFVVGYHYNISISPNHEKTPAIWKLSEGLGVIGDFGRFNGREDYGQGFFSDAILLCDGSILAKIYNDPWNREPPVHTDDRICLTRYDGGTGEPF